MAEEEKEEKVEKVVTAVYKVNLHCPKCAHDITKPLMRTPGVQLVDAKFEKGEITVTGPIDEKKILKRIEKLSKRNVQILPPPAKGKETDAAEKKVKETKKTTVATTTIKVYMHCDKCEEDLRRKLLMHKGIHYVKSNMKSQTITIEGTVDSEKLLTYMKKRVHKHAEIVPPKREKMEEKKEKEKEKEKEEKMEEKKEKEKKKEEKIEEKEEKIEEKKEKEKEKEEKIEEKKEKSTESTEVVKFKEEEQLEEKSSAEGKVPYFVHYVYAPQLFSDENPNACSIL